MSSDFYKCLVCSKYFTSFWNAGEHITKHSPTNKLNPTSSINEIIGRRRGMLSIQKVTFQECRVILKPVQSNSSNREEASNESGAEYSNRSTRKCRLNTNLKLKQVSKLLNYQDNEGKRSRSSSHDQQKVSEFNTTENLDKVNPRRRRKIGSGTENKLWGKVKRLRNLRCKNFRCSHCTRLHSTTEIFQKYLTLEGQINIKCECCDKYFENNINALIAHMKSAHPVELCTLYGLKENVKSGFKCDQCQYESSNRDDVINHIKTTHYKFTGDKFTNEDYMKRPFPCPICPKRFLQKFILGRHSRKHSESVKTTHIFCKFENCNMKFRYAGELRSHEKRHLLKGKVMRYKCHECPSNYARKDCLLKHLRDVHDIKMRDYSIKNFDENLEEIKQEPIDEIELVDKIVLDENGEAVHIKGEQITPTRPPKVGTAVGTSTFNEIKSNSSISLKDTSFICPICHLSFTRACNLQRHMRRMHCDTNYTYTDANYTYTGSVKEVDVLTLMCVSCAYPATDKNDLDQHLKTHNKLRCNWSKCGNKFQSRRKLEAHIRRTHEAVKKHFCNYCEKGFGSRLRLTKHMYAVHDHCKKRNAGSSKVMKKCHICGKIYSNSSFTPHLLKHKRGLIGKRPRFKCMLCHGMFRYLRQHIETVHMGKKEKNSAIGFSRSNADNKILEKTGEDANNGVILGL